MIKHFPDNLLQMRIEDQFDLLHLEASVLLSE